MKSLIPGGVGQIGSHMVKYSQGQGQGQGQGQEAVVLDDFSTGHE
ncbi:MAG: UDP-glucose 4-epimerase [Chitinophagales bacterium]|jgi:UDP-glucose 4-epimerase